MTVAHLRAARKGQSPRAGTTVQGLGKREVVGQAGFGECQAEEGRFCKAGQRRPGCQAKLQGFLGTVPIQTRDAGKGGSHSYWAWGWIREKWAMRSPLCPWGLSASTG